MKEVINISQWADRTKGIPSISGKKMLLNKLGLSETNYKDEINSIVKSNIYEIIQNVLLNHGRQYPLHDVLLETKTIIPDIDENLFSEVIYERKVNVTVVGDDLKLLRVAAPNT